MTKNTEVVVVRVSVSPVMIIKEFPLFLELGIVVERDGEDG